MAWRASVEVAEEEWWTVVFEEAWVTGNVLAVWIGSLLIQRGIVELEDMVDVDVNDGVQGVEKDDVES